MAIEKPVLSDLDWISIGQIDAVVRRIYADGTPEVVFDSVKPTTRPIEWDGERWSFKQISDFGGYAKDSEPSVVKLRAGWQRDLAPYRYT
jgi:hypothetical protein